MKWIIRIALLVSFAVAAHGQTAPHTACGNGDFEESLTTAEWNGADGCVVSTGVPSFTNFGLSSGAIDLDAAHQTRVDALVKDERTKIIARVAPVDRNGVLGASKFAVRIGNAVTGYGGSCPGDGGTEKLTKTFVVTQLVVPFWYAVVLQNPNHGDLEDPSFYVVVRDAAGNEIPGLVDLGNGKPVLVSTDAFLETAPGGLRYRPWSCKQIVFRPEHLGKVVTVEFVTEDCAQGGHYGYAYVDNVCGVCEGPDPTGTISFTESESTDCGRGRICFDYTLPTAGGQTGSVKVTLDIIQNGVVVETLDKPTINGTKACFDIDPAAMPKLSAAAGGFDFAATGAFTLSNTSSPKFVGSLPDGTKPGANNDYKLVCDSEGCCPGTNLVRNGNFEAGSDGSFVSSYTIDGGPFTAGAIVPGELGVISGSEAGAISSSWNAVDASSCSTGGKYLAVNGAIGQGGNKMVWSQSVPVVGGKEYRFCASFKNLPQCGFDVKPRVHVRFFGGTATTAPFPVNTAGGPCDWTQYQQSVLIPNNSALLTIEIHLDESGAGDGNDLAIDAISLQEMQSANPALVQLNIASANVTATTYELTATPQNGQPLPHYWEVCEVDAAGNCIAATQVVNPPKWFPQGPNNFAGYQQGAFNASLTAPGTFTIGKRYMVRYGVFSTCTRFTDSRWFFSFHYGALRVEPAL